MHQPRSQIIPGVLIQHGTISRVHSCPHHRLLGKHVDQTMYVLHFFNTNKLKTIVMLGNNQIQPLHLYHYLHNLQYYTTTGSMWYITF